MPKQVKDYKVLSSSLDEVLSKLQDPDVRVDHAIELYKQGLDLISQLENYLRGAENKVEQLKVVESKFDKG